MPGGGGKEEANEDGKDSKKRILVIREGEFSIRRGGSMLQD